MDDLEMTITDALKRAMISLFWACCISPFIHGTALADEDYAQKVRDALVTISSQLDRFDETWPVKEGTRDVMDDVVVRLQIGRRAWTIDDGAVTPMAELPFPKTEFAFFNYAFSKTQEGRPTVDIAVNDVTALPDKPRERFDASPEIANMTPERVAVLVVHEAFHKYVQTPHGWPDRGSDAGLARSTLLPAVPEPRLIRKQLIRTLKNAWLEPDNRQVLLRQARYLLDKYSSDHSDEARQIRTTDITEGTAEFAGVLFAAKALNGWDMPTQVARQQISKYYISAWLDKAVTIDMESYAIGLYAGLILNETRETGWQHLAEGAPLVELLLQDVEPAAAIPPASQADVKSVKEAIAELNGRFLKRAESLGEEWRSGGKFIALGSRLFPKDEARGFEMFARTATTPPGMELGLGFSSRIKWREWEGIITGDVILASHQQIPCGAGFFIIRASDVPEALIRDDAPVRPLSGGGSLICLDADDVHEKG
ncbi:hypothetical protein M218_04780 [Burkholderia pseudomallei MSHR338]|uniref:hypothetical protein n=1 Tax=Burkholderia pseudomallei TaxID=28450 RepID=UPI0001A488B7|nr:hypothetical protein [Burkholderia pseudomallei]ACQ97965.1 hypothetical protein GBP346_A0989 [Burkholderia pseudomallei MSHR346]AIP10266.1 hypothetical protein DP55_2772 [Burkholderia pseudomallei]EQA90443.1 hypothetical protein M218_04780 [Burkholderia pseudomallei MSHR338]OMW31629.1 hypothetical protein AQ807_12985 [Burkholderia pseudomallei]ONA26225.1 hypothetical protein AQ879_09170 [Burkholderia pseudomallei]